MPYIPQGRRLELFEGGVVETAGELNFLLTSFVINYTISKGMSYATFNEVVGVLESAKLEYYRRMVAPYENIKAAENGDVYGLL